MHAVHNSIGARIQECRALRKPCEYEKETFPEFGHRKLMMRPITMKEEAMEEKRYVPMND